MYRVYCIIHAVTSSSLEDSTRPVNVMALLSENHEKDEQCDYRRVVEKGIKIT